MRGWESIPRNSRGMRKRVRNCDFGNLGNDGDQSPNPAQQETNNETLEIVELGGDEVASIEEIDGVVREERLEYREEQVQFARKKGMGEEHHVLTALALLGEVILDQRQKK